MRASLSSSTTCTRGLELKADLLATALEWETPTSALMEALLEELEWHASTMVREGVLLLAAVRIIWIIPIVVPLAQLYTTNLSMRIYRLEFWIWWLRRTGIR